MSIVIVDSTSLYVTSRVLRTTISYSKLLKWFRDDFGGTDFYLCANISRDDKVVMDVLRGAEDHGWTLCVQEIDPKDRRTSPIAQMAYLMGRADYENLPVVLVSGAGELSCVIENSGLDVTLVMEGATISSKLRSLDVPTFSLRGNLSRWTK